MSATETWAMDIEDIVRGMLDDADGFVTETRVVEIVEGTDLSDQVVDTVNSMGVVTEDEIRNTVQSVMEEFDVPVRDDVPSEDDVQEWVTSLIYNGYIDVTDSIDVGQLCDSWDFRSAISEAVDDSALADRVNALEEADFENTPCPLAEMVAGHHEQVKNLTERLEYAEGVINSLVDHFTALAKSLTPEPILITRVGPTVPAFNEPTDEAPYAAI